MHLGKKEIRNGIRWGYCFLFSALDQFPQSHQDWSEEESLEGSIVCFLFHTVLYQMHNWMDCDLLCQTCQTAQCTGSLKDSVTNFFNIHSFFLSSQFFLAALFSNRTGHGFKLFQIESHCRSFWWYCGRTVFWSVKVMLFSTLYFGFHCPLFCLDWSVCVACF